ncbi:MAG: prolyl oligopeptidase family serine peptidase, partial [Myxococcota bacterium]|nr:prolyl oligopeptidase family serine peptidase [Myxococcota bacterium]
PAARPPAAASASGKLAYPPTRVVAVRETLHGVRVEDPYRWLENGEDPEVQAWAEAQDRFARERLDALPLTAELRRRFAELYYVAEREPPFRAGSRYFWSERAASQEKDVVRFRQGKHGEARTVLDPNTWSSDGSTSLGAWSVSRDGNTIAYQVRKNAADEASLHFIDVGTGRQLPDVLEGAKYSWQLGWSLDDRSVYYTWVPPPGAVPTAERPGYAEIRKHRLGTDPARDAVIWQKTGDPTTFANVSSSLDSDPYLFYEVRHGWVSRDVWFLDLRDPKARWKELIRGKPANYYPFSYRGRIYVVSDEGAPRGRVFRVDPARPARERWLELVPEHPTRTLQWAQALGKKLVLTYLDDVKTRIEVRDLDGHFERTAPLPGIGTATLSGHPDDDDATLAFTTFTEPSQHFRTSIAKGGLALEYQVEVPFDPRPYVVEQLFARSKDGTRVPAFVVSARDAPRDGTRPLLLYGYGGFGDMLTPMFWGSIVPWLEHGGSAAFANLRGGAEYGEAWHQAGMLHSKQNSIDDFHAVAEALIASGYTQKERLAIRGDSNGGLLVGAALVQRPELYRAVLCGVPLLDMLRYDRFGSGQTWIEEYGSASNAADFPFLLALSPYHHVNAGTRYPSVILLSATHDDRVDPLHARKFAAMLQGRSTGGPVLLRIETKAGHGGGDTIRSLVEQRAQAFAFLMHEVGMR